MSFRVCKSRDKRPSFLRSVSSISKNARLRPPQLKKAVTQIDDTYEYDDKLDDLGLVSTIGQSLHVQDVSQTISYIQCHIFDDIPAIRSGMNGARIAEILNFRKNLPPIVTNAHIHALIDSPTQVEKDVGQLVSRGYIRRIVVPGRGIGASAISDALVTIADWKGKVDASNLAIDLKGRHINLYQDVANLDRKI